MFPIINAKRIAQIDQKYIQDLRIPGLLLMEQAAISVCNEIFRDFPQPCNVLCIAGKGNNGGDALAVARILQTHGYRVRLGILSEDLPADANSNLQYFLHTGQSVLLSAEDNIAAFFAQPAQILVDGLFGSGLTREPAGLYREIIRRINAHTAFRYSIDLPSGVFADSGQAAFAVQADKTITFSYPKPGHFLYPGRACTGRLVIAPIAPHALLSEHFSEYWVNHFSLPERASDSNKGNYGKVAILAGSEPMSGAAVLCTKAAIAGGAGITYFLGCNPVCRLIRQLIPSAIARAISKEEEFLVCEDILPLLEDYHALVLGPGLGQNKASYGMVSQIAASDFPKVLDADALNLLSKATHPLYGKNTILTPHPGEFSRMIGKPIGEILASPLEYARAYARKYQVCLLLKGATTLVTDGQTSYFITAGTPGMAKGGSGDVLSGVIGALLAQGFPLMQSAYGAAYLCGKAAELAASAHSTYAMTPEHTIEFLGKAILQEQSSHS